MKQIIQNLITGITGYLTNLTTTNKSNLVAAINEVKNVIPTVANGEKSLSVKSDGVHADYNIVDASSASGTSGATLAALDWSSGSVTYTGVSGEIRFYQNYKYECTATNTWWRTICNLIVTDFMLGTVSDGGGVKTSAQMAALYPNAIPPQIVKGANGTYQYFGLVGWFYYENKITP